MRVGCKLGNSLEYTYDALPIAVSAVEMFKERTSLWWIHPLHSTREKIVYHLHVFHNKQPDKYLDRKRSSALNETDRPAP